MAQEMIYLTRILIFAVVVLIGYHDDGRFSFFDILGLVMIGLCLVFYDQIQKFLDPPS